MVRAHRRASNTVRRVRAVLRAGLFRFGASDGMALPPVESSRALLSLLAVGLSDMVTTARAVLRNRPRGIRTVKKDAEDRSIPLASRYWHSL